MSFLTWLQVMTALATGVTPVAKIESKARSGVPRYSIEQLFATRTIGAADWSPDGRRVVAVTNISGRNNLWLIPAPSGWPQQLTVSDERQASPAWSPDGRWIAFQSDHDANEQWDLFLVEVASGAVFNATNTDTISEEDPLWSADSKWIAYTIKPQHAPNYEIHLWDAEHKRSRVLTHGTPADWSLFPVAFVPGGKWLLANRIHASDKDADVVVIGLASGQVRNLTPHTGEQRWIATDLSPDGAWVLLTSNAKDGFDNVALLDLNAALARREHASEPPPVAWVTEDQRWEMEAGGFAPDGRSFTYQANTDGNGEIYLCALGPIKAASKSGSTRAAGTKGAGAHPPTITSRKRLATGSGYSTLAGRRSSFSPGGKQILYSRSAADSPGDLFALDLGSGPRRPITQAFVAGVNPEDMGEPSLVHYPSSHR